MSSVAYFAAYAGIAVFLLASVARIFFWQRMPIHMRWELYPVAHEAKAYGGSYFEEPEWWTKKRHTSLIAEIRAMAAEILFLVAVREHNRKLWWRTFPFHFGLYLVAACTAAMAFLGLLAAFSPSLCGGRFAAVVEAGIPIAGYTGLGLSVLGALGLLQRRLTTLWDFSSAADLFNLVAFIAVFGLALANALLVDRDFSRTSTFVANLVTLRLAPLSGDGLAALLPGLTATLMALLVAYIPLTHMSHFIGKYFAYHGIRWNDTPNLRGSREEAEVNAMLKRPVTWAAAHIRGDGKKTWAEACTEEIKK